MTVRSKRPGRCSIVALGLAVSLWNPMAVRAQTDPCANMAPPAGAKKLGFTHSVFCVAPTTADISVSDAVPNKLYSGHWYSAPVPMSMFANEQALALDSGAVITTETRKSTPGQLPLLPASSGFYVEFEERISDNDPDHWPAVWLMPQEHNSKQSDHLASDPPHFERWMELDVDEGGLNKTGHHGTVIGWQGVYPHYTRQLWANAPVSSPPMDRTQWHIFGLAYDPDHSTVTWWVDGIDVGSVSTANIPAFIKTHHYYLIMSNQTLGANRPYKMYVRYFAVWSATPVPNPPSGVHTGANP